MEDWSEVMPKSDVQQVRINYVTFFRPGERGGVGYGLPAMG